jgi:hypothetical protein
MPYGNKSGKKKKSGKMKTRKPTKLLMKKGRKKMTTSKGMRKSY